MVCYDYIGPTRNKIFFVDDSVFKIYSNHSSALTEKHYLQLLENKIATVKVLGHGSCFNELEYCSGMSFSSSGAEIKSGLDLLVSLVEVVNSFDNNFYSNFSDEYLSSRFNQFYNYCNNFSIISKVKSLESQVCSELKKNACLIVPNDYTPRNMLYNQGLVSIDHEDYVYSHPILPVVMFVKNPENNLSYSEMNSLIAYGQKIFPASDKLIWACNVFYDIRRSRCLARDYLMDFDEALPHLKWYINDLIRIL